MEYIYIYIRLYIILYYIYIYYTYIYYIYTMYIYVYYIEASFFRMPSWSIWPEAVCCTYHAARHDVCIARVHVGAGTHAPYHDIYIYIYTLGGASRVPAAWGGSGFAFGSLGLPFCSPAVKRRLVRLGWHRMLLNVKKAKFRWHYLVDCWFMLILIVVSVMCLRYIYV